MRSPPRKLIVVGNIYRPPNANISDFNTTLAFILEKIHELYSGAYDLQLCLDSNIDLFQISSTSTHMWVFQYTAGCRAPPPHHSAHPDRRGY